MGVTVLAGGLHGIGPGHESGRAFAARRSALAVGVATVANVLIPREAEPLLAVGRHVRLHLADDPANRDQKILFALETEGRFHDFTTAMARRAVRTAWRGAELSAVVLALVGLLVIGVVTWPFLALAVALLVRRQRVPGLAAMTRHLRRVLAAAPARSDQLVRV